MSRRPAQQPRAGSALARAASGCALLALLLPAGAAADTLGDQVPLSAGGSPSQAAAAYSPAAGGYEVAWAAAGPAPNAGLLARRLDAAAAPLGPAFTVFGIPHVYAPALAPAPVGPDFRLVYARDVGSGIKVVGAGVDSDASGSADAPDYDELPAIANAAGGSALVVWQRSAGCFACETPVPILAQRLDAAGQEIGTSNVQIATGNAPRVAYSSERDEWLVAYRIGSSIERVRVGAAGAVVGAPTTVATGASGGPAVAYDPDRDEYLVVWHGLDATLGRQQIFARRLNATGSPVGSVLTISADSIADAFDPDVAYNATAEQYAVAWTDTFEVRAQHLHGDGTLVGPRGFRVSFMGPAGDLGYHANRPRLAADATAGRWLVTWDGDNPDHRVWARLLAAPLDAPALGSVSPASRALGSAGFTLTLTGERFTPSSRVEWNGVTRPTTFVDDTKLTAAIPAADLAVPGNATVRVATPPPGGGPSAPKAFAITPAGAAPTVTSLPAIVGTAQDGGTLTCAPGAWTNAPASPAVRWLRSGAEIGGASAGSHLLTAADVGQAISCRVTASNASGTSAAVSASVVPDQADPVLPPPSPGGLGDDGSGGALVPVPAPGEPVARDAVAPRLSVTLFGRRALRTLRMQGLRIPVNCSEPCTLSARMYVSARTAKRLRLRYATVGRATRALKHGGKATLVVRLSRLAVPRLRGAGLVTLHVETRAVDRSGNASAAVRRVTLKG